MARTQATEIMAPHDARESPALGGADDINELSRHEMFGRELGADLDEPVLGDAELGELALRLELRLGEVAAHWLRHILHLGLADAELERGVAVLLLRSLGDDVAIVDL